MGYGYKTQRNGKEKITTVSFSKIPNATMVVTDGNFCEVLEIKTSPEPTYVNDFCELYYNLTSGNVGWQVKFLKECSGDYYNPTSDLKIFNEGDIFTFKDSFNVYGSFIVKEL